MVTKIHSCEDIVMNVMAYAKWGTNPIGIVTDKQCVDNYGVGCVQSTVTCYLLTCYLAPNASGASSATAPVFL